ncbi:MAG: homoserine dehydrogenase [Clostridiales bacterium]|jgi:homoserine dehydrogenase|nr:homoserine dehydrogenase [Clostridiales bacterium]
MAEIAVLGYGTVGSGVVEVLRTNQRSIDKRAMQPIRVRRVLDLRDFPGSGIERILTKDFNDILNDNDITAVVETMGGVVPAYDFVKKLLLRGKSVVTSNKELVAKHGAELLSIAREKNINFLFEASVGGGIPIIRSLNSSLTADEITEISGILNGTTNYILTEMTQKGRGFDEVLKEAQNLGYAEKNPDADVLGYDTCRKIAILISLAIGQQADFEDIFTEGITKITQNDIEYAKMLDCVIKLTANARIIENGVYARVSPALISKNHPLSMVNDVFNAIFVNGNVIGDVMFYGRGAGKLPTASAVVADVVACVRSLNRNLMHFWSSEKRRIFPIEDNICSKLVRFSCENGAQKDKITSEVSNIFGGVSLIALPGNFDEYAFVSEEMRERDLDEKLKLLIKSGTAKEILSKIRIEGAREK